jgi:CubicO group peptidase (beta-lactamase class C family)
VALAPAARAEEPAPSLAPPQLEAIDTAVNAAVMRLGVPGVSVAIASSGLVRFEGGYGMADLENEVPAKPATVYRLASVSKPMTAVAVLQLHERGLLDLDAPVWRYAPGYPEKPWPVTSRQLLAHLGGVRHYRDDEPTNTRPAWTMAESLAFFKDDALLHEPGTRFSYSTYGYNLLGAVVEGASGKPFVEYMRENVFSPAGMPSARVDEVAALIPHRAQGYTRRGGGPLRNSELADVSYKAPGGGLCANAVDVARFGQALVDGRLLKRETLDLMLTVPKSKDPRPSGYALGLNVNAGAARGARREAWHTGGQERVSTVIFLLPDAGVSVAVLTNLEGIGSELVALGRELASIASPPTLGPRLGTSSPR